MDPITAGLGALSIGSQIFAALRGGKANDANYELLQQQQKENEKFYNLNVNRDFMETNAAKGIFERLRDQFRDQNKVIENSAAVTGATPEAEIAAKGKNQENYNAAVNNLASNATQYQQNQEAIYRNVDQNLVNQEMALNAQKANNAANLAGNAADVMGAAATLTGFEDIAGKTPVLARTEQAVNYMPTIQPQRFVQSLDDTKILKPMPR